MEYLKPANDNNYVNDLEYNKLWEEIQNLAMLILSNPTLKESIIRLIKIKAERRRKILDLLTNREKFYY